MKTIISSMAAVILLAGLVSCASDEVVVVPAPSVTTQTTTEITRTTPGYPPVTHTTTRETKVIQ